MASRPTDEEMARVQAALDAGSKIGAIKIYREVTGVGLAEAKREVEQMTARAERAAWAKVDLIQVRIALDAGNKIEAIKRYREATGIGLREAKYAVEAMADGKWSGKPEPPRPKPTRPPTGHAAVETSSGCGSVLLLAVGLMLWAALR